MEYPRIVGDPSEAMDIDVKRFYVHNVEIHDECPKCKTATVLDLGMHYLSYPTTNTVIKQHLYCEPCGEEWEVPLILRMSLEIAK